MTAKKFCFCLKLETGCLLLGFTTFMLSLIKILVTVVFLKMHGYFDLEVGHGGTNISNVSHNKSDLLKTTFTLPKSALGVMAAFVMVVLFLWMLFSVLLMIGILKKRVNFVMTYFLFGIAISIMYMLSGLLEAISGLWPASLVTIPLTLVYIKCLTSVYAAYDKMRQDSASDLEQLIKDHEIDEPMFEC